MGEKGKDKKCQCCSFIRESKSHWLKQDSRRGQCCQDKGFSEQALVASGMQKLLEETLGQGVQ